MSLQCNGNLIKKIFFYVISKASSCFNLGLLKNLKFNSHGKFT